MYRVQQSQGWGHFEGAVQGIIQKKYGRIVFFFVAGSMGRAVSPPGGPGWCSVGGEAADFFLFFYFFIFCIKHAKTVIFRVSIGVENISNHSVVTLNNVLLTFSTIIKFSLRKGNEKSKSSYLFISKNRE